METTLKEQYLKIYESQDKEAMIPFLKSLSPKQKKELLIVLEECSSTFNHVRCSGRIIDFIYTATFIICCNQKQFSTLVQLYSLNIPELDKIFEWYCPGWFSKFLNKAVETNWIYLDYLLLVDWTIKGYIQPTEKLIAETLAGIFRVRTANHPGFNIKELDTYPVTLDGHIWLLFKEVSWLDISNTDSKYNASDKQDSICSQAFIYYTSNGRIDRLRVLRECLSTVNNNFKKDLLGEFIELYKRLNPRPEEIIRMQPELFNALASVNTVMIDTVLQDIAQITGENDFLVDDFLVSLLPVLSSKTKKIVISALSVLEQIAETKKTKREAVCLQLAPVFLNKDESIQKKAATILLQWADPGSRIVKENLSQYNATILQSVQTLLKDFLYETDTIVSLAEEKPTIQLPETPIKEANKIPIADSFDDFIFFLSQLFKSDEIYRVEYLPTLIKQFDKQITAEKLPLLDVIFKAACERVSQHCIYGKGSERMFGWDARLFKHIAALYLMEYGRTLINRYPEESEFLQHYYQKAVEEDKNGIEYDFYTEPQFTSLEDWVGGKRASYKPLHTIMLQNKELLSKEVDLPVLSLPTHTPAWVDPVILINRIKVWQDASHKLYLADLELALSRCFIENKDQFIKQAGKVLNEKYLTPVKEWFEQTLPGIERYTRQITWKISEEKKEAPDYTDRYALEISLPDNPREHTNSIFSAIGIDKEIKNSVDLKDLLAYLWFYPNTPEVTCVRILKEHFAFSQIAHAETRDHILTTIKTLADLKDTPNEITLLFLAACLLCSEKTIRDFAINLWIEKTSCGLLNNEQFGRITGELIDKEWTLPKRLTDAVLNNFLNIDNYHNQEIEKLLVATLSNIHAPVSNLKKLLETYHEVISLNKSKADTDRIPQLIEWESEKV